MTYSGLINIDTDLIKRLDFLTQQNEELVESTNTLKHCNEKNVKTTKLTQQKQEKNVKQLNQNSTQKIHSQVEVQSLTEIIHLLKNEAQVKISGLEQEILVLKEEIVKLKSRIAFVEATPGSSGYVPSLPLKHPIKTNNQFELLNKMDDNDKLW